MILSILKSYLTLLLSIGTGSIFIFTGGLYLILRNAASGREVIAQTSEDLQNLSAIAGDDVITTQLDLARAFIEADRKHLAAKILEYVIEQGNAEQQQEAQQLKNYK